MSYAVWKRRTADAIRDEAELLSHGKLRTGLLRKATAFRLCGTRTRVLACNNCKAAQLGSGVQRSAGHPCQTRICPCCQRRSSQKRRDELGEALANLEVPEGYGFKHVTITARYDPRDAADLTGEAMSARVDGLLRAVRAAWKAGLRRKGAGLSFTIEIAGSGHVHLHALYLGPFIVKSWLEKVLREAYPRAGHTHIADVTDANILFEVTKYHTKAPSPLRESWFHEATEVIHPTLAARWEAATSGRHLHRTLGAFRRRAKNKRTSIVTDVAGAETDAPQAAVAGDAAGESAPVPCASCGHCAGYSEHEVDTFEWVARCRAAGVAAFHHTRLNPRPRDASTPRAPDSNILRREVITL